jgi:hypothetical protein
MRQKDYQTALSRPRDYAPPFVNFGQEGIHPYSPCKIPVHSLQWQSDHDTEIAVVRAEKPVSDVCIKEDLGYEAVMGIIQRHIKTEVEWSEIERLDVIGIDEISLKKGHKDFVTVVTARTDGRIIILAVLNGRKKSTVKAFLASIPKRLKKTILALCSDLYEG